MTATKNILDYAIGLALIFIAVWVIARAWRSGTQG